MPSPVNSKRETPPQGGFKQKLGIQAKSPFPLHPLNATAQGLAEGKALSYDAVLTPKAAVFGGKADVCSGQLGSVVQNGCPLPAELMGARRAKPDQTSTMRNQQTSLMSRLSEVPSKPCFCAGSALLSVEQRTESCFSL